MLSSRTYPCDLKKLVISNSKVHEISVTVLTYLHENFGILFKRKQRSLIQLLEEGISQKEVILSTQNYCRNMQQSVNDILKLETFKDSNLTCLTVE